MNLRATALFSILLAQTAFGQLSGSFNLSGSANLMPAQNAIVYTPVLWWNDTGSGTTIADATGNGWTGTLENTGGSLPTWVVSSYGSGGFDALSFASHGQVITASAVTQISSAQHASISFWADLSGQAILGAMTGTGYRFGIFLQFEVMNCYVEQGGVANAPYAPFSNIYDPSWPSGGTHWHFFVVTFDGTQSTAANRVVAYIDAVSLLPSMVQSGGGNPSSLDTSANMSAFSANTAGDNAGWAVQNVELWNQTLSQGEINLLYNGGTSLAKVVHERKLYERENPGCDPLAGVWAALARR